MNADDLEKLRVEFWCTVFAARCIDASGITPDHCYSYGETADQALKLFDKRFKPERCAHVFYAPSTVCAKCGESMPAGMAEALGKPLVNPEPDRVSSQETLLAATARRAAADLKIGERIKSPADDGANIRPDYTVDRHQFDLSCRLAHATGETFLGGALWCRRANGPRPLSMNACACDGACKLGL